MVTMKGRVVLLIMFEDTRYVENIRFYNIGCRSLYKSTVTMPPEYYGEMLAGKAYGSGKNQKKSKKK